MSFEKIFDLTAGVFFFCLLDIVYRLYIIHILIIRRIGKVKLKLTTFPRIFIHAVYQFISIVFVIQRKVTKILRFP